MEKRLTRRFWLALTVFGLMGQAAWVVENMYLNVFIYKMFHASAADISLMVGASSVAATGTTILMGAFTDHVGKRKLLICGGYMAWGVSILAFAFLRMDLLTPLAGSALEAASLGVTLVILLDCVMTFLGSMANDASFNAWMTDWGDENSRGRIEGINSMMPLVAILVVFGGFSAFNLDRAESWTVIYTVVGAVVILIGVLGIFLIEESPAGASGKDKAAAFGREEGAASGAKGTAASGTEKTAAGLRGYAAKLVYSFRPSVMRENPILYGVIGAFAVFGISIQSFMPYLILYYEKTLGMTNYVWIMAPAIVLAAVATAFYGKLFDLIGFRASVVPTILFLCAGYLLLAAGTGTALVFAGSLLMMTGYLTGMAIFGAMIRSRIPEGRAGQFQGVRIIGQVLIPGIAGPALGAAVLKNARQIVNADGTVSFLPNRNIFLAALAVAVVLLAVLSALFRVMRRGHYALLSQAGEELLQSLENGEKAAETVWDGYPRPQLRRDSFYSLNGIWRLNGRRILVPFPPQARLSGYEGPVRARLCYEREFTLPRAMADAPGGRLLLHFGAVDQVAEVFLNGHFLGKHEGGYLPFVFDITGQADRQGTNRLLVKAKDTLSPRYPYGKQRRARGGMWYTPVSGIWQSVWLEQVPEVYLKEVRIAADLDGVTIEAVSNAGNAGNRALAGQKGKGRIPLEVEIRLHDGNIHKVRALPEAEEACVSETEETWASETVEAWASEAEGSRIRLRIPLRGLKLPDGSAYEPRLWTPEDPYLYRMRIILGEDTASSYFGLRTVEIRTVEGLPRVCLNGEPVFWHGVLDQGYFCDGLYLPARQEEYEQDVFRMKELGFNLLRKHGKLEPECFYYYCDTHGMLVMQDMVNSGIYSWLKDTALPTLGFYQKGNGRFWGRRRRKEFFRRHMRETILHLQNHPSVISYTIFNEGWGQFDSDLLYQEARELDPARLYDATSGWFPRNSSDFDSQHIYFLSLKLPERPQKPVLVSECGGYSWTVPGHSYAKYTNYGYGGCRDSQSLTGRIGALYRETILTAIPKGLAGCVYTQLSDVEDETNGCYTYDRRVCKVDRAAMRRLAKELEEKLAGREKP